MCRLSPTGDDGDVHMRGLISPMRCEKREENSARKEKPVDSFSFTESLHSPKSETERDFLCVFHEIFLLCVTRRQIPRVVSKSAQLSRLKSIAYCSKDRTGTEKQNRKWTSQKKLDRSWKSPACYFSSFEYISRVKDNKNPSPDKNRKIFNFSFTKANGSARRRRFSFFRLFGAFVSINWHWISSSPRFTATVCGIVIKTQLINNIKQNSPNTWNSLTQLFHKHLIFGR